MPQPVGYISGLDKVVGLLNPNRFAQIRREAMQQIVLLVEGEVKAVTPVRTGNLRRSITGKVMSPVEGVVGTNVVYAPYVHRRNPYLTNGLDNAQSRVVQIFTSIGGRFFEDGP